MAKAKQKSTPTRKEKVQNVELKMLGDRIRNLRISKGYTSYETFAYEHGIPRTQFGRYEKGEDLRYSSLLKVVNAFEMDIAEFFSEGFE